MSIFKIILDVTGGGEMFWAASYGYIADITSEKNRTKRLAYLDGLTPLAFIIGMLLGATIKEKLGYKYNFVFGILIRCVCSK